MSCGLRGRCRSYILESRDTFRPFLLYTYTFQTFLPVTPKNFSTASSNVPFIHTHTGRWNVKIFNENHLLGPEACKTICTAGEDTSDLNERDFRPLNSNMYLSETTWDFFVKILWPFWERNVLSSLTFSYKLYICLLIFFFKSILQVITIYIDGVLHEEN